MSVGCRPVGDVTSQTGSGTDAPTASRNIGYDADGRVLNASTTAAGTAPASAESFTYNDRGEPLTATGSAGASSFSYNPDGLMATRTDAAGATTYTYDGDDRLKTLADPTTGALLNYSYTADSQPNTVTYGTGGDTRKYTYDNIDRLASDTLTSPTATTVASIGYGYDANGNLTSKTTTGFAGASSNTYTYDYANRLTSWNNGTTTKNYGYDLSGNRTQVGSNVYTYDARDELTGDGINSYTYTARGTLASQTGPGGTVASTFDAYDQAISQGTETYAYDASGRTLTAAISGGASHTFSYTGTANTLAADGANTYSRDPGDGLVGTALVGGGTSSGHLAYTDQHTDVVGDYTATATTLAGSTSYDPLGNVIATSSQAGQLGYQSGWTDPTTSTVNMDSRLYNPATGQFMNKDTVSPGAVPNSANANPFAYVDDNPMTGTDPTGHCWVVCSVWHAATSAYHSVASTVTNWYDDLSSYVGHIANRGMQYLQHEYRSAANCVHDLRACGKRVLKRAKRGLQRTYRAVKNTYHKAVHAVKTATHKVVQAAKTAGTYIKHHAAAIVSAIVSTGVFIGCDAALVSVVLGQRAELQLWRIDDCVRIDQSVSRSEPSPISPSSARTVAAWWRIRPTAWNCGT